MSSNVIYDSIHSLAALEICYFPCFCCLQKRKSHVTKQSLPLTTIVRCAHSVTTSTKIKSEHNMDANTNLQIFELCEFGKGIFVHVGNLIPFKISVFGRHFREKRERFGK